MLFTAVIRITCQAAYQAFRRYERVVVVGVVVVVVVVEWERIRGPAAPMHLGRMNGPLVHRFPPSSPEAFHVPRSERPLSVKEGSMGEKWPIEFCRQHATSTVSGSFTCRKSTTWDRRL
jgi:hypothetical protein